MLSLVIIFGAYLAVNLLAVHPAVIATVAPYISAMWWRGLPAKMLILSAMTAIISWRIKLENLAWRDIGWREGFSRRELAWGLLGALAIFASSEFLWMFQAGTPNQGSVEVWSALDMSRLSHQLGALMSIGALTGVSEELFGRGAILGLLRRKLGGGPKATLCAVLVSSLVFAGLHGLSGAYAYFMYFVLGLILSSVYVGSDSLKSAMLAHVLANSIRVLRVI